jgi:hypothetical protein
MWPFLTASSGVAAVLQADKTAYRRAEDALYDPDMAGRYLGDTQSLVIQRLRLLTVALEGASTRERRVLQRRIDRWVGLDAAIDAQHRVRGYVFGNEP